MWILDEAYERAKERLGLITAILGVIAACIYLTLALNAGSTECNTPHSCSKTTIGKCRDCKVLPPTPGVLEGPTERCRPGEAGGRRGAALGTGGGPMAAAYH
jgi:hypothetical protein